MATSKTETELQELVRRFAIRFGHPTLQDGRPCVTHNGDELLRDAFIALGWPATYFLPKR
jgi:hypothetical protein